MAKKISVVYGLIKLEVWSQKVYIYTEMYVYIYIQVTQARVNSFSYFLGICSYPKT